MDLGDVGRRLWIISQNISPIGVLAVIVLTRTCVWCWKMKCLRSLVCQNCIYFSAFLLNCIANLYDIKTIIVIIIINQINYKMYPPRDNRPPTSWPKVGLQRLIWGQTIGHRIDYSWVGVGKLNSLLKCAFFVLATCITRGTGFLLATWHNIWIFSRWHRQERKNFTIFKTL